MELAKIPKQVLDAVRQREKFTDAEIGIMTPRELFEEYCNWHGIINWGDTLWETMQQLQQGMPRAFSPMQNSDSSQHQISGKTAEELWLETGRLRAELADLKAKPKVAVWLEDGVVQGAIADKPVDVVVIECDDLADREERILVPKADGSEGEAVASAWDADVDPQRAAEVFEAVGERRPPAGMKP
ncbi:hypothetical protein [Cupriavidus pinatubonensis]|uniref:Uncharacterized protein n=1 Tax=Cupriavidus pinatubonensis TaxID=248026 RepID=A0ABM8WR77_9BURK|nr:hypothetical protein [Cupriavidus pinatubonensis]CAG9169951.1 hypothetical protein LMG23994_01745 [Cupriavidus pinatubonensis]